MRTPGCCLFPTQPRRPGPTQNRDIRRSWEKEGSFLEGSDRSCVQMMMESRCVKALKRLAAAGCRCVVATRGTVVRLLPTCGPDQSRLCGENVRARRLQEARERVSQAASAEGSASRRISELRERKPGRVCAVSDSGAASSPGFPTSSLLRCVSAGLRMNV